MDRRSSIQPMVGCRYGCARNAVAVTSVSSNWSGSFSPPWSSEMMTVRSDSHSSGSYKPCAIRSASMNNKRIERIRTRRFQVCRLIDPGVSVPGSTETLDDPLHLVSRDVRRAFEIHVLDPVRDARMPWAFIARTDAIPAPDRHQRRGVHFLDQNLESVIEARFAHGRQMKHRLRHGHIVHYTGRLAGCRTTPAW